jgi:hypothetical protein
MEAGGISLTRESHRTLRSGERSHVARLSPESRVQGLSRVRRGSFPQGAYGYGSRRDFADSGESPNSPFGRTEPRGSTRPESRVQGLSRVRRGSFPQGIYGYGSRRDFADSGESPNSPFGRTEPRGSTLPESRVQGLSRVRRGSFPQGIYGYGSRRDFADSGESPNSPFGRTEPRGSTLPRVESVRTLPSSPRFLSPRHLRVWKPEGFR